MLEDIGLDLFNGIIVKTQILNSAEILGEKSIFQNFESIGVLNNHSI